MYVCVCCVFMCGREGWRSEWNNENQTKVTHEFIIKSILIEDRKTIDRIFIAFDVVVVVEVHWGLDYLRRGYTFILFCFFFQSKRSRRKGRAEIRQNNYLMRTD